MHRRFAALWALPRILNCPHAAFHRVSQLEWPLIVIGAPKGVLQNFSVGPNRKQCIEPKLRTPTWIRPVKHLGELAERCHQHASQSVWQKQWLSPACFVSCSPTTKVAGITPCSLPFGSNGSAIPHSTHTIAVDVTPTLHAVAGDVILVLSWHTAGLLCIAPIRGCSCVKHGAVSAACALLYLWSSLMLSPALPAAAHRLTFRFSSNDTQKNWSLAQQAYAASCWHLQSTKQLVHEYEIVAIVVLIGCVMDGVISSSHNWLNPACTPAYGSCARAIHEAVAHWSLKASVPA